MKNLILASLFILASAPLTSKADEGYKLGTYKPEIVFSPKAFDTNDNAQVVLYGKFIDVCHKVGPAKFKVDQEKKRIYIDNQVYSRALCIEMYVNIPYTVVVDLGTLPEGKYDVYASNGTGGYSKAEMLPITAAKSNGEVDNFFYAQVDDAKFIPASDASSPQLLLKGTLHNTCLSLREIKVSFSAGNVYDILPIMDVSHSNCKPAAVEFERTITLDHFPKLPALLNIRSSGGQSVEKVIDLKKLF
ncbi:MAG: hypothetical protein H7333_05395 [Bdellovibrionales bacterium]|nr:hypothetical protein [Oligoflexia bacterium]